MNRELPISAISASDQTPRSRTGRRSGHEPRDHHIGPIEALCELAHERMTSGRSEPDVDGSSTNVEVSPSPLLQQAARPSRESRFEAAVAEVLRRAKEEGLLPLVLPVIDDLHANLRDYDRSFRFGVLDIIRMQKGGFAGVPVLVARSRLQAVLLELRQFASLLPPPALEPLTESQQEIWDLLEQGPMTIKDLMPKLASQGITEAAVRDRIYKIMKTGRVILHRAGVGYYRPGILATARSA